MVIGVCQETFFDERRVGVIPDPAPSLMKRALEVLLGTGARCEAGITDCAFEDKGAKIAADRPEVFPSADAMVRVRTLRAAVKED